MKRHIPNLITLLNLGCGTVAIVLALEGQWHWAVYLVLAAAILDFLDGFMARVLRASSDTGRILDALADMVTFGLLPAIFIYLIFNDMFRNPSPAGGEVGARWQWILLGSVVLVPVLSAIRLARFSVGKQGTDHFSGLPTPASALFWTGLFWQFMKDGLLFGTRLNAFYIWAIMFLMSFYLILPVPMVSLKFENYSLKGNLTRILILLSAAVVLPLTGIPGLSLVVLLYILVSLLNLLLQR